MIISLKERLEKAASLVGVSSLVYTASGVVPRRCEGRVFVSDVGCDHAYLSLFLVLTKRADGAIASDVRAGPLAMAKQNIEKYGCDGKIETKLTNGLNGIEVYDPTDILICGMGGDTIISILSEASFIKTPGKRLILQPQTGVSELFLYLHDNGFLIYAERYAFDAGKSYRIIAAEYCGENTTTTLADAVFGKLYFDEDKEAYRAYLNKNLRNIEKRIKGTLARHGDVSYLQELHRALLAKISSL